MINLPMTPDCKSQTLPIAALTQLFITVTGPTLALVTESAIWPLLPWHLTVSIALRFSSQVALVPNGSSGLKRRRIREILGNDVFSNLFHKILAKSIFRGHFQGEEVCLKR